MKKFQVWAKWFISWTDFSIFPLMWNAMLEVYWCPPTMNWMYYPRCVSSARLTISTVDFGASVSRDWDVELSMFAFAMSAFSMLVASP